jgi:hypothetical protein
LESSNISVKWETIWNLVMDFLAILLPPAGVGILESDSGRIFERELVLQRHFLVDKQNSIGYDSLQ